MEIGCLFRSVEGKGYSRTPVAMDTTAMSLLAFLGAPTEMIVVALVALLLFGNRLPSVMRSLGQSVTEFKKGMEGVPDEASKTSEPAKKLDDQPVKS